MGTLHATVTQASTAYSKVEDHKIVFSDIVLAKTSKGVLAADDFTTTPADGYGPSLGRLSDQVGFISMRLNQPELMQAGSAVPRGKLSFSMEDSSRKNTSVELPVPAFPAASK